MSLPEQECESYKRLRASTISDPCGFTIVSFYTEGTAYKQEAERLAESCKKFDIDYRIECVPNLGSWQKNTQHKATFLRWMRASLRGPIVWLDADAEVASYPDVFGRLAGTCDIAVHYRRGRELLSGTVWLDDNPAVGRLLDRWIDRNERHPKKWDQSTLADELRTSEGIRVHHLDAPYCLIFDRMRDEGPPVILHHQASRRLKRCVLQTA